MPRSRYSNDPSRPPQTFNVYSRSNGEPTEGPYYRGQEAEVVEIGRNHSQNNQNQTSTGTGNDQQARLIELYTGNDGVSEVGQTVDRTNSQYVADGNRYNSDYGNSDVGKVRARVVSVTPPPATAIPTETGNTNYKLQIQLRAINFLFSFFFKFNSQSKTNCGFKARHNSSRSG